MVFQNVVVSTLCSGLTGFTITTPQENKLNACMCKLARQVMGKSARTREEGPNGTNEERIYKSKPTQWILAQLQAVPIGIELAVQRSRWYQQLARSPTHNNQLLTAIFAHFAFERERQVHTINGTTHGYVKQMIRDFEKLSRFDEYHHLYLHAQHNLVDFFTKTYRRSMFLDVDPIHPQD